jgi:hypothetical protein
VKRRLFFFLSLLFALNFQAPANAFGEIHSQENNRLQQSLQWILPAVDHRTGGEVKEAMAGGPGLQALRCDVGCWWEQWALAQVRLHLERHRLVEVFKHEAFSRPLSSRGPPAFS